MKFLKTGSLIGITTLIIGAFTLSFTIWENYKSINFRETPIFKYAFSRNENLFSADGGDNFDVDHINWIDPYQNRIINHRATVLPVIELNQDFYEEISERARVNPTSDEARDILNCIVYRVADSSSNEKSGVPLIAQIYYTFRGDKEIASTTDLVYIRGLNSAFPELRVEQHNATNKEIYDFTEEGRKWIEFALSEIAYERSSAISSGGCRIKTNLMN